MQISLSQNILALRTQLTSLYEQIERNQTAEPQTIFNSDRLQLLTQMVNRLVQTIHLAQVERSETVQPLEVLKDKLVHLNEQANQVHLSQGNIHTLLTEAKELKDAINQIYLQTYKPIDTQEVRKFAHQEEFEEDAVTQLTYENIRRSAIYFQFHFPRTTNLFLRLLEAVSVGQYGEEIKEKTISFSDEIWNPYPFLKLVIIHLCRSNRSLDELDCLPTTERNVEFLNTFKKSFPSLTNEYVSNIILHVQKLEDQKFQEGLKALNELVADASSQLDQKMFLGLSSILQGKIKPPTHLLDQILLLLYEGRFEEAQQIAQSSLEPIKSQAVQMIHKQRVLFNPEGELEALMRIEQDTVRNQELLQMALLVVDVSPELAIKVMQKIAGQKEQTEAFLDLAKYIQEEFGDSTLVLDILEKAPSIIQDELYQEFAKFVVDRDSNLSLAILMDKISPERKAKAFKEVAAFILSGEVVNPNRAGDILHQMSHAVVFQDLNLATSMIKQIDSNFLIGAVLLRLAKTVARQDLKLSVKILKNIEEPKRQAIALLELAKFVTNLDVNSAIAIVKEASPTMSLTSGLKELAKFLLNRDPEASLDILLTLPNSLAREKIFQEFSKSVDRSNKELVLTFTKFAEKLKATNPELADSILKNIL